MTKERDALVEKLTDAFDVAHSRAMSLISRQEEIVRSLNQIRKILLLGASEAAVTLIDEMMARDLKQAVERVRNQDAALRIAIARLQSLHATSVSDNPVEKDIYDELSQIKLLAPLAFEPMPAGPAVRN